jgi:acyl carrier protein
VGDLVTRAQVAGQIRAILAELTGLPLPPDLPSDTPLLRDGVGLDSLGATLLLLRVRDSFGVDVAGEDLNLDSLASIGTLAAFVADRVIVRPAQ